MIQSDRLPDWFSSKSPGELSGHRAAILSEDGGGCDPDHDDIANELGVDDDVPLDRWFDVLIARWSALAETGEIAVHRAMSVDDLGALCDALRAGADVGAHWTHDESRASTGYHGGPALPCNVVIAGSVAVSDVCWPTTLQQNFGHPGEREIFVSGCVRLHRATDVATGREIPLHGIVAPALTEQDVPRAA